jgi:hypothetical protein
MKRVPSKRFTGRPGNPNAAPRCGAQTRSGKPCRAPAMMNPHIGKRLRCRFHGGASTGPRTPEGRARIAAAQFKHGRRTKAAEEARKALRAKLAALKSKVKGTK